VLGDASSTNVGRLAFDWDGSDLRIAEAELSGAGSWRARGGASAEQLDLELLASGADFSPLLKLLPALRDIDLGASGDLLLRAQGSPANPEIALRSELMGLRIGATHYALDQLRLTLIGQRWQGSATLRGVDPLTGTLVLNSTGSVRSLLDADFDLTMTGIGSIGIPQMGTLEGVEARVDWLSGASATLAARGTLGAPFTISGSLVPLDLTASGRNLRFAIPSLAIPEAQANADLRLRTLAGQLLLSGAVVASSARVDLATRVAFLESEDTRIEGRSVNPDRSGWDLLAFDGLRISAPQRVSISEPFISGEAMIDLTLDGTAFAPRLSGEIRASRGAIRFGGRDLDLQRAVAQFDPTRGVYPSIDVAASTRFEKQRVASSDVRFTAPSGNSFELLLELTGEAREGENGFTLDLSPTLTSNALVEAGDGLPARPLSEAELVTLLTIGRLQLASAPGAVAQSAIDTALDLLITSELDSALSAAIGLDVVEFRTSAVSSLFEGEDPFGVSLRLGGYLSDEVFASYQVDTRSGSVLSNEVGLAYQLGPLALDLSGRFNLLEGGSAAPPEIAFTSRYGFGVGQDFEFGIDLRERSAVTRIGFSWRW
jgi:hypothetical protein